MEFISDQFLDTLDRRFMKALLERIYQWNTAENTVRMAVIIDGQYIDLYNLYCNI